MGGNVTKFSFFESFWEAAKGLSDTDRLAFFDAVCEYAFTGEEPCFDGIMSVVWALAKPNIDSSVKGQKAGSEGGRGKKKNPSDSLESSTAKGGGENVKPPLSNNQNPPFAKSKTNKDMDMDKERDMEKDKDRERNFSKEKNFSPLASSGGAAAAKAAPPRCPLCESELFRNTQSGRWTCTGCCETYPPERFAA